MLRKLECLLLEPQLEGLRDVLAERGVEGMTVSEARGIGTRSKKSGGKAQFQKRVKVEIVLEESIVDETVRQIKKLVGSGRMGAGMIFVIPVEDAIRLATREAGKHAIV
jgi:nitrogen regulatory protein PII